MEENIRDLTGITPRLTTEVPINVNTAIKSAVVTTNAQSHRLHSFSHVHVTDEQRK
jgi:hypothetical protein